jgi:hypothetical protein
MRNTRPPQFIDQVASGGYDDTTMAVPYQVFGQVDRTCLHTPDI